MNGFVRTLVAFGLAAAGSTALAAQPQPALMTDAEMDNVTAGSDVTAALVSILAHDRLPQPNPASNVAANVNARVALVGTASAVQGIATQTQITGNLS
jgi:hypothetical protein